MINLATLLHREQGIAISSTCRYLTTYADTLTGQKFVMHIHIYASCHMQCVY